jgi:MFS family permease
VASSVETGEIPSPLAITLGDRDSRRVIVVMSLAYALLSCSLSAQVALPEIRRTIPMSDVVTSLHGSFFGWALLVGGLFFSKLSARVGRSRFLALGVVGLAGGAVLFATGHVVVQTLAGAAITGVSGAILVITVPGLIADAFGDRRSLVFTRLNAFPALAGLLFPLAVSAAPSVSLSWRWPTIVFPVALTLAMVGLSHSLHNDERAPRTPTGLPSSLRLLFRMFVVVFRFRSCQPLLSSRPGSGWSPICARS